ncbi:hypothetical protein [Pseudoxanthomonas sp.]|uniref:hypothetical protein n=1 Tax=Pseudoxanthomonas sp. TaxID=1871049 RepID=UPI0025DAC816|nr:hypothetical protein [Pseudoxanthomonas sp.]
MDSDLIVMATIVLLAAAGLVATVLLPAWIAWAIAWRSGMPRSCRRSFAFACLLLSYGVMVFAAALLLPLEVLKTFIASDLHARGYRALANGIFVAAEHGTPIVSCTAALVAAVVIPLKLRRHWPAITSAVADRPASPAIQRDADA